MEKAFYIVEQIDRCLSVKLEMESKSRKYEGSSVSDTCSQQLFTSSLMQTTTSLIASSLWVCELFTKMAVFDGIIFQNFQLGWSSNKSSNFSLQIIFIIKPLLGVFKWNTPRAYLMITHKVKKIDFARREFEPGSF